jgi:hypothetical protein
MATILLRKSPGTGAVLLPAPAVAARAEPFWAQGGFTDMPAHVGGNDLAVYSGAAGYAPLVSPQRQVELIGAQTVTGAKTFSLASFLLQGGTNGQLLSTTGVGGVLTFVDPPTAGVSLTFGIGLTLTGTTVDLDPATGTVIGGVSIPAGGSFAAPAGALTLLPATAAVLGGITVATVTSGLILSAAGALSLGLATAAQHGGITVPGGSALTLVAGALGMSVANAPAIETGADNVLPITPLGLRGQLGLPLSGLQTTAPTIIPAINELKVAVDSLAGNLRFGGVYDVAGNVVTPSTGSPFPAGALVAATGAMTGWYLIASSPAAGVPGPLPPAGNYAPGDWLIVDNGPAYIHLQLGALALFVDNVSIIGDGLSALTALRVAEVDGGTY